MTNKINNAVRVSKQKVKRFQQDILNWFKVNGRTFLWRQEMTTDTYILAIAEILLQRTKAETINNFYLHFLKLYPSWTALAKEDINILEENLKPIGLASQRALRLQKLATIMVEKDGKFPTNRKDLEALPGIGQYIANAILLFAHGEKKPLLDVNMARVLERVFGVRKLSDIRYDPYLQKLSYKVVEHEEAVKINWAILDFAAILCKKNHPLCSNCLMKNYCLYYKENNP